MGPPARRRRVLLAVPALLYAAAILVLSSRPGSELPSVGPADKFLHVVEYFVFGILLLIPVRDLSWRARGLAIAVGIAFAAGDELLQAAIPGRLSDAADFLTDAGGLLAAAVLDATVRRWRGPDGAP